MTCFGIQPARKRRNLFDNIHYYSKNAETLSQQYNSIGFEKVHRDWISEIPEKGFALDVGAGSGRDARYLAAKGL
ncbi:MAG: hypothetical protein HWD84_02230, partial [Flavobacteriaceae bacterium]|nr:hypothetical protein [Flavobacteriaceae bacterium]